MYLESGVDVSGASGVPGSLGLRGELEGSSLALARPTFRPRYSWRPSRAAASSRKCYSQLRIIIYGTMCPALRREIDSAHQLITIQHLAHRHLDYTLCISWVSASVRYGILSPNNVFCKPLTLKIFKSYTSPTVVQRHTTHTSLARRALRSMERKAAISIGQRRPPRRTVATREEPRILRFALESVYKAFDCGDSLHLSFKKKRKRSAHGELAAYSLRGVGLGNFCEPCRGLRADLA